MFSIREQLVMTSAAYLERARGWVRTLEDREAARNSHPVSEARPSVARRTGISPGTLANIRNGRLKAIAVHVYDRLRAAVIRELETEVRHLEHELQLLRTAGVDPREGEMEEVVASLAKVREALGLPPSGAAHHG